LNEFGGQLWYVLCCEHGHDCGGLGWVRTEVSGQTLRLGLGHGPGLGLGDVHNSHR
jgi:hypothetical protein